MKRLILPLLTVCAAACGGAETDTPRPVEDAPSGYSVVPMVSPGATKGSLLETFGVDDEATGPVTVAVYREGALVRTETGTPPVSIGRLVPSASYSIYSLSGQPSSLEFPESESDVPAMQADYLKDGSGSFAEFISKWKCIPMAGSLSGLTPAEMDLSDGNQDGFLTVPMERLFARIDLTVNADERILALCPSRRVTGISVDGAIAGSPLFGETSAYGWKSAPVWPEGDRDDMPPAGFGKTVSVYLPENLQGDINTSNTDPSAKSRDVLEGIMGAEELSRLSYVEITVDYSIGNPSSGDGGTVRYRFYIGDDALSNFDIRRNRTYAVTLNLTYDNMFTGGDWKIDTEGFTDSRRLLFTCVPQAVLPGRKVCLGALYEDGSGLPAEGFSHMYREPLGYAFGTESEVALYAGSMGCDLPREYDIAVGGTLECLSCHAVFGGFPAGSIQRSNFIADRSAYVDTGKWDNYRPKRHFHCPYCGIEWYSSGNGEEDPAGYAVREAILNAAGETEAGSLRAVPGNDRFVEIGIPESAAPGTSIVYKLSTADGMATDRAVLRVASDAPLMFLEKSDLYLAEKTSLGVVNAPSGAVSFEVTEGMDVVRLSNPGAQSADVEAIGCGDAAIVCRDSEGKVISTLEVRVGKPAVSFDSASYEIPADGTWISTPVTLKDKQGNALDPDPVLREEILQSRMSVSFSGCPSGTLDGYQSFDAASGAASTRVSICTMSLSALDMESSEDYLLEGARVVLRIENPTGDISGAASVSVQNPFRGWPESDERHLYWQRQDSTLGDEEEYIHELGIMDVEEMQRLMAPEGGMSLAHMGFSNAGGTPVHTASGTALQCDFPQDGRIGLRFSVDGAPILFCRSMSELPYSRPCEVSVYHELVNKRSGQSWKRYLLRYTVSERVEPVIHYEHIRWKPTFGFGYHEYSVFLDFSAIGEGLPFSPGDLFDCTVDGVQLLPAGDYPDWHYYDEWGEYIGTDCLDPEVFSGVAGQEAEKTSDSSYLLTIYQELVSQRDLWSMLDYFSWNSSNLMFHLRGSPETTEFDLFFLPDGSATGNSPGQEAVYWVSYREQFLFPYDDL